MTLGVSRMQCPGCHEVGEIVRDRFTIQGADPDEASLEVEVLCCPACVGGRAYRPGQQQGRDIPSACVPSRLPSGFLGSPSSRSGGSRCVVGRVGVPHSLTRFLRGRLVAVER